MLRTLSNVLYVPLLLYTYTYTATDTCSCTCTCICILILKLILTIVLIHILIHILVLILYCAILCPYYAILYSPGLDWTKLYYIGTNIYIYIYYIHTFTKIHAIIHSNARTSVNMTRILVQCDWNYFP